jgi:hypothetical protein
VVGYSTLRKRAPWLSLSVAAAIIAAGVALWYALVQGTGGDRTPVERYLLIAGVAASFDARTRSRLYTQLVFSGLVMFFASEMAVGNAFALLLGGYLTIVLAFLWAAYFADQRKDAEISWFGGKLSVAAYWGVTAVAVVLASAGASLLLTWVTSQTPQAEQTAALPFNGAEEGVQPGIAPSDARSVMSQADTGLLAGQDGLPGTSGDGEGAPAAKPAPFDAPSVPGLHPPATLAGAQPLGSSSLLERRTGESLSAPAARAPSGINGALDASAHGWPYVAAATAAASAVAASVWWFLRGRSAKVRPTARMAYTRLDGPERRRVLHAFARAERALTSNGFRRRRGNEPFGEYAASAQRAGIPAVLGRLAAHASRAAYSACPVPPEIATEAEDAARQLKAHARAA